MESEDLYSAPGWKLTVDTASLPDGREKKAVRAHRPDTATILAFVRENIVLILREFRPFYGDYIWMLPSGRIDKEDNKEAGAQRELREETGRDAKVWEFIGSANYSESVVSTCHFFTAHDLFPSPLPQDADELIEVQEATVEDALEKVLSSKNIHLASAYALMRYLRDKK
jgi:ADP-ribose pyrophosphatase